MFSAGARSPVEK